MIHCPNIALSAQQLTTRTSRHLPLPIMITFLMDVCMFVMLQEAGFNSRGDFGVLAHLVGTPLSLSNKDLSLSLSLSACCAVHALPLPALFIGFGHS
jgi:hypothetical protein